MRTLFSSVSRCLLILLPSGFAGGCAADDARLTISEPSAVSETVLSTARTRWLRDGAPSYRLRTTVSCFCPAALLGELETTVRDTVPVQVLRVSTGERLGLEHAWTVSRLFALIESEQRQRPTALRVRFDDQNSLPREVRSGSLAADDGIHVAVTRYEPFAALR